MNRRAFIKGLGAFMILPGAGRIWKATRDDSILRYQADGLGRIKAFWWQTNREGCYMTKEYRDAMEASLRPDGARFFNTIFNGHRIDGSIPPAPPPRPGYLEWDLAMERRWKPS